MRFSDVLASSGRNRPAHYGPSATYDPASRAGLIAAEINKCVEAGIDPADVAARVLSAIRNDELYVFTHPRMRYLVDGRFAAIAAAMDAVSERD